jgi:hypothetical protein
MGGYQIFHLEDMIKELGENRVKSMLSTFSCPQNKDVEDFIRVKAITFEKQSMARTHLIFTSFRGEIVLAAFFALTNKFIFIPKHKKLSQTMRKKINRYAVYNSSLHTYIMPIPLIAQLGKNFYNNYNTLISGDELLSIACNTIRNIQKALGGKFVYLECEDKTRLLEYYERNGFFNFGKRALDNDEKDKLSGEYLIQMVRFLKSEE